MADMPFGSYQGSPEQAYANAARIMAAGAHMVKIEGGQIMAETVTFLTKRGIPVCAHIGLTPQSVHQLGGYKVQGNTDGSAQQLLTDAKILENAPRDSQGNVVIDQTNKVNGYDNSVIGKYNGVNGNQNGVFGVQNSVQGHQNSVNGSNNVSAMRLGRKS